MINYNWNFPSIETYTLLEGQENVVCVVHWQLVGVDSETGASADRYGMQSIAPYESGSVFVPYSELTAQTVQGWVTGIMGSENYNELTGSIVTRIADINAPVTHILPPPWA